MERARIQELARAGLRRAKAEGKRLGRPRIDGATEEAIRKSLVAGSMRAANQTALVHVTSDGGSIRIDKHHFCEAVEKSMTYNKYNHFLMYEDGEEYDTTYKAGARTPFSGIYYCEVCGGSITSIGSQPLPSQGHHLHTPAQGSIRWRLAVKSHYA